MKNTIFIAILLFSTSTFAQQFSVGLRTGAGMSLTKNNYEAAKTQFNWDKELFLRYESKKHMAFELSAIHYSSFSNMENIMTGDFWNPVPAPVFMGGYTRYNTVEYTGRIQYRLTNTQKRLQQFAGLSLGMRCNYEHVQYTMLNAYDQLDTYRHNNLGYDIIGGGSYLASYGLTKHLKLQGALAYNINLNAIYDNFNPFAKDYGRINVRFGAGYTF